MPVDERLLAVAIVYHASELERLLRDRSSIAETNPQHVVLLIAALLDFLDAEGYPTIQIPTTGTE